MTIGLPLTIVAGTVAALLVFSELSLWEAALLAAILAPTDAALGQAVVSSKQVPVRMRQALNVESGLNDGIVLPVVLILFSVACATARPESAAYWIRFAALQVTLGPAVGIAVGYVGGKLIERGSQTGWISPVFRGLATPALALVAFGAAELVHGNGFIAAFCAGMTLGNTSKVSSGVHDFAEAEGQLLTLMVFTVFGALTVPLTLRHLDGRIVLYAVLSLTAIRMIPVAISLLGRGLQRESLLFVGWFGPRGIASILFALLVVEGEASGAHEHLLPIIMMTVLLSVFAHGASAFPGTQWYARRMQPLAEDPEACEHMPVSEMPVRSGEDERAH